MKYIIGVLCLIALSVGMYIFTHTPFPNAKTRDAIGEKVVITPNDYTGNPGNITVEYYVSGQGPRIVFVASAGREAADFNELVTTLNSKGFRTLAVEHPGIGQTSMTMADLNIYAFPLFTALQNDGYLNDDLPYFLVGHAFGNRVARVTSTYLVGESSRKPILSGTILLAAGGQTLPDPEADAALKRIFNPNNSYKSRMEDLRYAFFAGDNKIPDYWTRGWHTNTAIAQSKAKGDGDDSWHCAGGVPMLIVQPMQDRIAPPENAYALLDKCPQEVEIVEVQNAGHALLPEQPEAIAKAVLDFLAKHHPVE